jgi:hypothetical protein
VRNRVSAIALWLAATVLATTAVWAGTGAIGDAARSDTDLVVAETSTTTTAVPASPTSPPPTSSPPTTLTPAPTTTLPGAPPPTGSSPGAAPGTTSPPRPGLPTSIPALPVLGETRTYVLTGGTVTVRFASDAVTVVLATPNPGFGVDAEQRGAVAVRVEFESDQHRSRLDASWSGGPVDEVREDG